MAAGRQSTTTMSHASNNPGIKVQLAPDHMTASVVILEGADAASLTPAHLARLARESGVVVEAGVEERLAEIVESFCANPGGLEADFAHGRPPVHGERVRRLIKRWVTQALNRRWPMPQGGSWWAEEGSNLAIHDESYLNNAFAYIRGQRTQ